MNEDGMFISNKIIQHAPVFGSLDTPVECRVDVFEKDEAAFGDVGEEVVEFVVCEASFGDVEDADVVGEGAGEGLDE